MTYEREIPEAQKKTENLEDLPEFLPVPFETVRQFGHEMVNMIVDRMQTGNERPIFPEPVSNEYLKTEIDSSLPIEATDPFQIMANLDKLVTEYSANFLHPGIISWVASTPLPLPGLIDGYLSALRIFPFSWRMTPASIQIELITGQWLGKLCKFSDNAFPYFTTGGTMANLYGLAAALTHKFGDRLKDSGLSNLPEIAIYTSDEAHICIEKSVILLGIGRKYLRRIPVDSHSRIDIVKLKKTIKEDVANNIIPVCIVGTVGTTLTGSIDPIEKLVECAREFDTWLHIDGAYGALAALGQKENQSFEFLRYADSLVIDPHKWLNIPFEAGCILVKDKKVLSNCFTNIPSYLSGGGSSDQHDHWHYGFELSRADRAIKVWFMLKQYGTNAISKMISSHIEYAEKLYSLLLADPNFEPLHKPELSTLCFRFCNHDLSSVEVDQINQQMEAELTTDGNCIVASATYNNIAALRVCFVNHRTKWETITAAIDRIRSIGLMLSATELQQSRS